MQGGYIRDLFNGTVNSDIEVWGTAYLYIEPTGANATVSFGDVQVIDPSILIIEAINGNYYITQLGNAAIQRAPANSYQYTTNGDIDIYGKVLIAGYGEI